MISEKFSFKGFNILKFIARNKLKIIGVLNLIFPYEHPVKIIITGILVVGEEIYKYYSKVQI